MGDKKIGDVMSEEDSRVYYSGRCCEEQYFVEVSVLRKVFPGLFGDMTDSEFAHKVKLAAELAEQEDALVELQDNLKNSVKDMEEK